MMAEHPPIVSSISRKGLLHWGAFFGKPPAIPDDLAAVCTDCTGQRCVVTWPMVMQRRREMQAMRLSQKRAVVEFRAWKLWVAYYDQELMGGWQAFIEREGQRHWIDRDRKWLMRPIMDMFPVALFGDWHDWKAEFAKQFERRRQYGRPVGVAFLWFDGTRLAKRKT